MGNYPWLADSWPTTNLVHSGKEAVNCCTTNHDTAERYYNGRMLLQQENLVDTELMYVFVCLWLSGRSRPSTNQRVACSIPSSSGLHVKVSLGKIQNTKILPMAVPLVCVNVCLWMDEC